MGNSRLYHAMLYLLTLLVVTVWAGDELVSPNTILHPRTTSKPARRQDSESKSVPLYGDTAQPELGDIYQCTDNGQIEAPIAGLRMTRPDILLSLQTMNDSGTVKTKIANPMGQVEEFDFDSTQLTDQKSAWFPAFVDAFNQSDQKWPLPEDGKPPLGSRAARNVNALLWDRGYATYTGTWWNDTGKVNYFGRASDENQILLAYTNANQLLPIFPWTKFGYAPLSAIRDMSQPDQPVWPPSLNLDGTRYGISVLMWDDSASYVPQDWELSRLLTTVMGLICSG